MLDVARKDNLYENYFVEYITKDPSHHTESKFLSSLIVW